MTPEEIKAAVTAKYNSAVETFNRAQPGVFGQAQPVFIDDAQPAGPMPEPQEDLRSRLLTELDAMSGIHTQSVKDRGNGTWGESLEFVSSEGSTVEPVDFQTDSPSPANSADGFELTAAPVLPQNFDDVQFSDSVSPSAPEASFSRQDVAAHLPKAEDLPFPASPSAAPPAIPPSPKPEQGKRGGKKMSPHVRRNKEYLKQFHERRASMGHPQAMRQAQAQFPGSQEQPGFEMQSDYASATVPEASPAKGEAAQPEVAVPQRKSSGPGVRPTWQTGQLSSAATEHPAMPQADQAGQASPTPPIDTSRQGQDQQMHSTVTYAEEQDKAAEMIGSLFESVANAMLRMQSRLEQVERILDKSFGGYMP